MDAIVERKLPRVSGWVGVLGEIAIAAVAGWLIALGILAGETAAETPWLVGGGVLALVLFGLLMNGFFLLQPNQSKVFTFFGRYAGTAREAGFHFANPLYKRAAVSLRMRNLNSPTLKVNDAGGNPIEIGAVVVWQVTDSAKALFDVEGYEGFVAIQCETAIRALASRFPYDSHDDGTLSLRGNPEEVARVLTAQVQERLDIAGVSVHEARISHLAYAPEIAQAMLRRQQAEAVIAARRKIVDGAVGMVQMALASLESQGIVNLDEERKAAMVNNLLVALVSDSEAQPIINTGTLYS